jgi:hypothetical protein
MRAQNVLCTCPHAPHTCVRNVFQLISMRATAAWCCQPSRMRSGGTEPLVVAKHLDACARREPRLCAALTRRVRDCSSEHACGRRRASRQSVDGDRGDARGMGPSGICHVARCLLVQFAAANGGGGEAAIVTAAYRRATRAPFVERNARGLHTRRPACRSSALVASISASVNSSAPPSSWSRAASCCCRLCV